MAFEPSDQFANYSAVLYENLGTTLAPLAGLLGAFAPEQARGRLAEGLGNVKPFFVAAYAGQDQVTVAATGKDLPLGAGEDSLLSGDLGGILGNVFPMARMHGRAGPVAQTEACAPGPVKMSWWNLSLLPRRPRQPSLLTPPGCGCSWRAIPSGRTRSTTSSACSPTFRKSTATARSATIPPSWPAWASSKAGR